MTGAPATPVSAPGMTPYPQQQRASDPRTSVWVAASAGSGKTKVLADRVLRLMLDGANPERILCLTFTRAAAAEMANRINVLLGKWASASEDALISSLSQLMGATPEPETRAHARRLFAEVLDVPGGLKIQTIHSFCQSLLGRFPLESGIAPHFELMDERTSNEVMHAARDDVLRRAAAAPDSDLARALSVVTDWLYEDAFSALMEELGRERGRIERLMTHFGGVDAYVDEVAATLGADRNQSPEDVRRAAAADDAFDGAGLGRAVAALAEGSANDAARGMTIQRWLETPPENRSDLDDYYPAFLTDKNEPRKRLYTKAVAEADPVAADALGAEALRLARVIERCNALHVLRAVEAVTRLAAALLETYTAHKEALARLDYDDLILRARRLLETGNNAAWVLFKLDGGIDHILIDEAQDTNPDQWAIVRAIAEEFYAGAGARDLPRTVFAVGDAKQSIFSFQRADPEEFHRMNAHFADRVERAAEKWDQIGLDVSFRSTPAVLTAVDAVFADPDARDGLGDAPVVHTAHRTGQPGLVELWPTVKPDVAEATSAWEPPPVQINVGDLPATRLARVIAHQIARWIGDGEMIPSRDRAIRASDILVLVQRRTGFVDDLVRELKNADIGVAGVDRMVLSDQLAVMDLVALGQFLLLPEDDLTLATVLKGPLIGMDEDALFDLAYARGDNTLWHELRRRAGRDAGFESAAETLARLLSIVDRVTPFTLYAEILGPRRGRERIVARLGIDSNDPLDEFLSLALVYERGHPPSLQGFLQWFLDGRTDIKRDLEQAVRDEVRIMTVHGAKGLQAPIVMLADTVRTPVQAGGGQTSLLWHDVDGWDTPMMLWRPKSALSEPVTSAVVDQVRRRRDQEYRRLLYVAMTRAEDRLYVCGYETRHNPADGCWYNVIRRGLSEIAEPSEIDLTFGGDMPPGWSGGGLRLVSPPDAPPDKRDAPPEAFGAAPPLPVWADRPAPEESEPPASLAPSRPEEDEPAMMSPLGDDGGRRFNRGNLIHALLQYLPDVPLESRDAAARRYLAPAIHGLTEEEQDQVAKEALSVMNQPEFADLFGPGSRAEVPIVGVIGKIVVSGRVDRLVVTPERAHIVDFKTNRPPPMAEKDVPALYLRQLAAYRAVLSRIYPDLAVDCSILWTDGLRLMTIGPETLESWAP